jgi:hypothetical protein
MPPLAPARASNKEDFGVVLKAGPRQPKITSVPDFTRGQAFLRDLREYFAFFAVKALAGETYFDTAANKSECSRDWNCLSSALKCICKSEPSEFTTTFCKATFSTGVAVILR